MEINFTDLEDMQKKLNNELADIVEDKSTIYEQIKSLQKEERFILNNISFFEQYLGLLEMKERGEIDEISQDSFVKPRVDEGGNHQPEKMKKYDVIEENIRAFEQNHLKNPSSRRRTGCNLENLIERGESEEEKEEKIENSNCDFDDLENNGAESHNYNEEEYISDLLGREL